MHPLHPLLSLLNPHALRAWARRALISGAVAACAPVFAQTCASELQLSEDLAGHIAGSGVAVVGRPHDLRIGLIRRDPGTGVCTIDTSFTGSLALKVWRTDLSGAWSAPALAAPAVTIPASKPGAANATVSFVAGLANLTLVTNDVGHYRLSVADETLVRFPVAIGGALPMTVRPFALVLSSLTSGSTVNPATTTPTGAVFTRAGVPFSASISAYRWSAAADVNDDGRPDAAASLAQVISGGVATGFATPVNLSPLLGSQLPAAGVLGALANPTIALTGGAGASSTLSYSEVGSFRLATAAVLSAYQATPGADVDLVVARPGAIGDRDDRVGRFTPDHFDTMAEPACGAAPSAFTYSGQPFMVRVVARSALAPSTVTRNYDGAFGVASYAKDALLSPSSPAEIGSLTNPSVPSSSFQTGTATLLTPSGPVFTFLNKLTAPMALALRAIDVDAVSSETGVEAPLPLRSGRLRVFGASGSERAALDLPLQIQHWSGNAWAPGTDDTCSTLTPANLALSGRTNAAATYPIESVTLAQGSGRIRLGMPSSSAGSAQGSIDLAVNLGGDAADRSCLPAHGGAPAHLSWLRSQNGACATTFDRDPSVRATFGIFTAESHKQIHVREVR